MLNYYIKQPIMYISKLSYVIYIYNWIFLFPAADGQHIYLHSINVTCLKAQYGNMSKCPGSLTAKIVHLERIFMDEVRQIVNAWILYPFHSMRNDCLGRDNKLKYFVGCSKYTVKFYDFVGHRVICMCIVSIFSAYTLC